MPRNPSTGVYSKPAGTTPSVGQVIDPVPWNALTTDLGNEITNSLPRDGSAPMVAPFKAATGTVSAPGLGFASTPQTGLYLKGGGLLGFAQNGVDITFDPSLVYAAKAGNYTALASDDNAVHRFTANATLSLTAAATLAANWHYTVIADGGDVTIDPNGSETIDGAATLFVPNGGWANLFCSGSAFFTNKTAAQAFAIANMKWRSRFIGEVVYSNTALTGAEIPPSTTTDTVWIELTSGLTGVGGFNNGKLRTETVSGSAPLVSAFATIDVGTSPMYNTVVRLLNSEGRIIRPSTSPGTLQDDQIQDHGHGVIGSSGTGGGVAIINGSAGGFSPDNKTAAATVATAGGAPRIGLETRMKNIGVKAYMRIA
ncbi:hypothetical protein [Rhizobium leguminosarum]|uniref:hypothetical protein n=1 Tax=Rhizobium leguminosarum TaxID=384 RepID=UPI0021BC316E|nr:hypothetical protein [Rhizobium leguminosarum]